MQTFVFSSWSDVDQLRYQGTISTITQTIRPVCYSSCSSPSLYLTFLSPGECSPQWRWRRRVWSPASTTSSWWTSCWLRRTDTSTRARSGHWLARRSPSCLQGQISDTKIKFLFTSSNSNKIVKSNFKLLSDTARDNLKSSQRWINS